MRVVLEAQDCKLQAGVSIRGPQSLDPFPEGLSSWIIPREEGEGGNDSQSERKDWDAGSHRP